MKFCKLEPNSEVHSTKWWEWPNANSSDLVVCLIKILIIIYPACNRRYSSTVNDY